MAFAGVERWPLAGRLDEAEPGPPNHGGEVNASPRLHRPWSSGWGRASGSMRCAFSADKGWWDNQPTADTRITVRLSGEQDAKLTALATAASTTKAQALLA